MRAIELGANPRWRTELYYDEYWLTKTFNAPRRGIFWNAERKTFSDKENALIKQKLAVDAMKSMDRLEKIGKTGAMKVNELIENGGAEMRIGTKDFKTKQQMATNREHMHLDKYRQRLSTIMAQAEKLGAQPIYITQAYGSYRKRGETKIGAVGSFFGLDAYNRALMDFCQDQKIACIDLGGEIEFQSFDHWDHEHTTPLGSRRIADFLCARMLEDKILEPGSFVTR